MGAAACKKDEIEIKNLYQLYLRVSKQKLPDQIASELLSIRTRIIKDKVPKECQLIYNILLNNTQDEAIFEILRLQFQQVQNLNQAGLKNDRQYQVFLNSFRFLNLQDLRKYIQIDFYKNNNFISEILNLFYTIELYCQKISLFLSRISPKYYLFFYSLLWKQYKHNVNVMKNIYHFHFIDNNQFNKIPLNFTFQLFMYKIWGNNIQPQLNKIQIGQLLHDKTNEQLIQYFNDFIEISINEYQLIYSGNIGLKNSKGFQNFLNILFELLNEEFDGVFNKNVEKILNYIKENKFLNQILNEQILIHYIYPSVFEYIETHLSQILKETFKITKKYLLELIVEDKVSNKTLSKLLLEEYDENLTKYSQMSSSQCKTNYTSSLKVNYFSVQNQEETTFFNYQNNKWEHFSNIQHQNCMNIIELSTKVDEEKKKLEQRSSQFFKTFNTENLKQQEFIISYINIILDYTYVNKQEEISELILQFNLFY
ncbi:unnamed protein product [Paramecium sonneborni]|uniref:Uncharacterized protein n=1 Tax=Paramecium sonneborni TaxID=65129 RepID=A0A8S1NGV6_9CILI|nr:unnamed protein product [Paramecium sonneborni]